MFGGPSSFFDLVEDNADDRVEEEEPRYRDDGFVSDDKSLIDPYIDVMDSFGFREVKSLVEPYFEVDVSFVGDLDSFDPYFDVVRLRSLFEPYCDEVAVEDDERSLVEPYLEEVGVKSFVDPYLDVVGFKSFIEPYFDAVDDSSFVEPYFDELGADSFIEPYFDGDVNSFVEPYFDDAGASSLVDPPPYFDVVDVSSFVDPYFEGVSSFVEPYFDVKSLEELYFDVVGLSLPLPYLDETFFVGESSLGSGLFVLYFDVYELVVVDGGTESFFIGTLRYVPDATEYDGLYDDGVEMDPNLGDLSSDEY